MKADRLRLYLQDILDNIALVEEFVIEGENAFMRDKMTQYAVIRAYEIIGEIVKRLPTNLLESFPAVEWQNIIRLRDFVAHQYERVRLDYIWEAVKVQPLLKATVESMANELDQASAQSDNEHE